MLIAVSFLPKTVLKNVKKYHHSFVITFGLLPIAAFLYFTFSISLSLPHCPSVLPSVRLPPSLFALQLVHILSLHIFSYPFFSRVRRHYFVLQRYIIFSFSVFYLQHYLYPSFHFREHVISHPPFS